jgi:methylase of polypeptide subunit release factors
MRLSVPSDTDAELLASVFDKAGYRTSPMEELLEEARIVRTAAKQTAASLVDLLARWFLGGESMPEAGATGVTGEAFVSTCLAHGLLQRREGLLEPSVVIAPVHGLLIAGDLPQGETRRVEEPALAINAPALALLDYTVKTDVGTVLDLCSGGGVLGLVASRRADRVVGIDLSPRAIQFGRLNARLNGIHNVEFLEGNAFEPVAGRRFDQIVCNPPFIMTPSRRFMFSDTGEELDSFCRSLVEQAPGHLVEGGYFQMICNWAQVVDENWSERIRGWVEGSGCDAWILSCNVVKPEQYISKHANVVEMGDQSSKSEWLSYLRERRVEFIHSGFIMLRRRDGDNWTNFSEIRTDLTLKDGGEHIAQGFLNRDLLHHCTASTDLLASRPKLAPGVSLKQLSRWDDGWKRPELTVQAERGWNVELPIHADVLPFLTSLDGSRSVGDLAREASETLDRPLEDVERECCRMAWQLLEFGILDAPESVGHQGSNSEV